MDPSGLVPTSPPTQRFVLTFHFQLSDVLILRLVTPGNRVAAVVGGFNVIVFTIIAILDYREKKQKRKNGELTRASVLADSPTAGSVDGSEKRLPLGDEEDISPVRKE
jgi:hypothetical protein